MDQSKNLECPFTWAIDENLALSFTSEQELCVSINEEPTIAFMDAITLVFIRTLKKNFAAAHQSLLNAEQAFEEMFEVNISKLALCHILEATKYYYYMTTENKIKAFQALLVTPELKHNHFLVQATLDGCKSLIWSTLSESDCTNAIDYAEKAMVVCPNCPLWHFVLAKNLRCRRNCVNFSLVSTPQEIQHYWEAYELSNNNPYYGIYLAQVLKECNMYKDAQRVCLEMYSQPIESIFIKLKLALNFSRVRNFEYAMACLNEVESVLTEPNSTFLLYKGIYFQKVKNLKAAASFFKQAGEMGNYKADIQYALCMMKIYKGFDLIEYFNRMLKKYENDNELQQRILLHMGMKYYEKKNVETALIYLLKAVEIDINSKELKNFWNNTSDFKYYNIFDFLKKVVLPEHTQKLNVSNNTEDRKLILETLHKLDKVLWRFQMINLLKDDLRKKNENKNIFCFKIPLK